MLLSLSDMPIGWTSQSTTGGGTLTGCSFKKALTSPALAKAEASFGDPSGVAAWYEGLAAERSSEAKPLMTTALNDLDSCHSLTAPASSGQPPTPLTVATTSFPAVGDQSGAFTLSGTIEGIVLTIYIVLARFGSVEGVFFYGNLGTDVTQFQSLVSRASAKIRSVSQ